MSHRHDIPWPRIWAEGLVVVISILLALAADAWWDTVQERREQAAFHDALREDLQATRDDLSDGVVGYARFLEQRVTTLLAAVDTLEMIPVDSLRELAAAATRLIEWEPTIFAYGDGGWSPGLTATENVGLLRALGQFEIAQSSDRRLKEQFTSMSFQGALAEVGRTLGSIYILVGPTAIGDPPERFQLSDAEFRAFLRRRDVYATLELVRSLHANRARALEQMDLAAGRAIDALDGPR